jgi:predicted TIM-barrel fold metal-dependent hydrolase
MAIWWYVAWDEMTGAVDTPEPLRRLFGRFLDCDAHLYQDPDVMAEIVGPVGGGYVLDLVRSYAASNEYREAAKRAENEVWIVKGLSALGATDTHERVRAMDKMGIQSQLLFPNTSLRELRLGGADALDACRRYNDYALVWTKATGGRARVVCQLNMTDPDAALKELTRLVDRGADGVLLPCARPPGGKSPAHPLWDPLWRLLEESDTPALIHIGAGGVMSTDDPSDPMLPDRAWADAPALRAAFADMPGAEERIGPFFIVTAHLAAELYLTCLVMGGVFERFPRLRFGAIEFGASWVGPMAARLDRHAALLSKVGINYSLKPSEFLERNVRVTPYWTEPVHELIKHHGLAEVYVFNTDYPHVEGGKHPLESFSAMTEQVGTGYAEDFFVRNAKLLFPRLG